MTLFRGAVYALLVDVEGGPARVRAAGRRGGSRLCAVLAAGSGLAFVLACRSGAERASPQWSDSLAASLIVRVASEEVGLVFQLTNATGSPIAVDFPSQQRFDFVVSRDGRPVWTWSADKLFAQAALADTLPPWETWRFEAQWAPPPDAGGTYEARARLASSSLPVRATAEFRLP